MDYFFSLFLIHLHFLSDVTGIFFEEFIHYLIHELFINVSARGVFFESGGLMVFVSGVEKGFKIGCEGEGFFGGGRVEVFV